jgi:hypothetical protein
MADPSDMQVSGIVRNHKTKTPLTLFRVALFHGERDSQESQIKDLTPLTHFELHYSTVSGIVRNHKSKT